MAYRYYCTRMKAGGNPTAVWRVNSIQSPVSFVERFVFGSWRAPRSLIADGLTVAQLSGGVTRGLYHELPEAFGTAMNDVYFARVGMSITATGLSPVEQTSPGWWRNEMEMRGVALVTETCWPVGGATWWLTEVGSIQGEDLKTAAYCAVQHTLCNVEKAAAKYVRDHIASMGQAALVIQPSVNGHGLWENVTLDMVRLSEMFAETWTRNNGEAIREQEKKAAQQKLLEAQAAALREQARLAEEDRQRRIAAGDVTVIGDGDLAARLRAKREKGLS